MGDLVVREKVRPFLRWAGGKSWLAQQWPQLLGDVGEARYFEPFLGGGAVYLTLAPASAHLSDLNKDLIETYQQIRDEVDSVIEHLRAHRNTEAYYYSVRGSRPLSPSKRAARFIYLNQTSFNGIYRVNREGAYNVPYGYRSKAFLDEKSLRDASAALTDAVLEVGDFETMASRASAGDFVFLDPPYTVSHNNNGFIKYNQHLFSIDDQRRLAKVLSALDEVGAKYVLTNAAHPAIAEIFSGSPIRLELFRATRVGGRNAKRGMCQEYLFTNLPLEGANQ